MLLDRGFSKTDVIKWLKMKKTPNSPDFHDIHDYTKYLQSDT